MNAPLEWLQVIRDKGLLIEERSARVPAPGAAAPGAGDRLGTVTPIPGRVCVTIPIRTATKGNTGGHWAARARRTKAEREAASLALAEVPAGVWAYLAQGCTIRLTRIAPRQLDAEENLPSSMKAIKDVIAQLLFGGRIGQRDSDPRAKWEFSQVRSEPRTYGVMVSIITSEVTSEESIGSVKCPIHKYLCPEI